MASNDINKTGTSLGLLERFDSLRMLWVSVCAAIVALIIGGFLFRISGADAFEAYATMFKGAFGSQFAITQLLTRAIPLLIIALGLIMVFRANIWNIGAEGQFMMGALGGGAVVTQFSISPGSISILLAIIAGAMTGGSWGAIVGWLRAKWEVHEVITSLLLNFVAIIFFSFLVRGPLRDPSGFLPESKEVPDISRLPIIPGIDVNIGVLIAIALTLFIAYILTATPYGLKIRMIGSSPSVAKAAGLDPYRMTIELMAISGAMAGIAGVIQVLGVQFYLGDGLSPGFGFTAILVALLGRLNPFGAVLAAIALSGISVGGSAMQITHGIPTSIVATISALIVMFLLIAERLSKPSSS